MICLLVLILFMKTVYNGVLSVLIETYNYIPVDTGHNLNVHKTFRRRPGRIRTSYVRSVYVLCLWGCLVLFNKVILKSSFRFDDLQKCLLQKRNSSVDIDILNKFVFLNSSCSEKLATIKNYLFTRSCCSVDVWLRISSYFEKITAKKK